MTDGPLCIECGVPSRLVGGDVIYPHRPDLYEKRFWQCPNDPSHYCGCHGRSRKPLGYPCGKATKLARNAAHRAFDPMFERGFMRRSQAYRWLAGQMGLTAQECHIGMFNAAQCDMVVDLVDRWRIEALDMGIGW